MADPHTGADDMIDTPRRAGMVRVLVNCASSPVKAGIDEKPTAAPKRRGRPPGSGSGRTRTEKLNLSVTPAGKLAIQQAAERAGMSVGEWAETCATKALKQVE